MILPALSAFWTSYAPQMANHLWQSTLFVVLAAILAFVLRKNQGRVRYWVWLTASLKFLIPFSLLIALGSHLARPKASTPAQAVVYSAVEDFSQPFAGPEMPSISEAAPPPAPISRFHLLPPIIVAAWLGGILVALLVWAAGWIRVSRMVHRAVPLEQGLEVEALRRLESILGVRKSTRLVLSRDWMEPGIFGVFRPLLIWPEGISQHLDDRHVDAILAHEIYHARRRDNLTAVLHMLVEAIFWFHPLVWWVGKRLEEERERACDEEVSLLCQQPQVYAECILRVCKFCSESPLACVSGITGADLKKRIVEIMRTRAVLRLTWGKKLLIGAATVCAIAVPVMLGQAKAAERMAAAMLKAAPAPVRSVARAMEGEQTPSNGEIADASPASVPDSVSDPCSTADGAKFDVVSIRPSKAWSGDWDSQSTVDGVSLSGTTRGLIQEAFGLRDFQVIGGPNWIASDTFDIKAKFDVPEKPGDQAGSKAAALRWTQRYRSLLQEQFQFRCHMETKELPVYDLVVAKGGAKLKPATAGSNDNSTSGHGDAHKKQVVGTGVGIEHIVEMLARYSGRTVVDKTGLTGKYDFTLNWSTERQAEQSAQDGQPSLPELPTALEEQLGLKLVPSRGPVAVLVIDHIEKPTVDGAELQAAPPVSVGQANPPKQNLEGAPGGFKVFVNPLEGSDGASASMVTAELMSHLIKHGIVIVETADKADAVLNSTGQIQTGTAEYGHTRYRIHAAVRLVDKDGKVLWADDLSSSRYAQSALSSFSDNVATSLEQAVPPKSKSNK